VALSPESVDATLFDIVVCLSSKGYSSIGETSLPILFRSLARARRSRSLSLSVSFSLCFRSCRHLSGLMATRLQGTGALPEATIKGEILKNTGNENYKRVGSFEGDLAEALSRPDEMEGAGDEDE